MTGSIPVGPTKLPHSVMVSISAFDSDSSSSNLDEVTNCKCETYGEFKKINGGHNSLFLLVLATINTTLIAN